MSTVTLRRTPIEIYVKQWLKANTVRRQAGLDLLRKAAAYIDEKIATDCCDPENPIINLYTRKESVFVRDVYTMLYGMSRKHHIQSLTRTRNAILYYVENQCCFANNFTWAITGPTGTVHSAVNPYIISVVFTLTGNDLEDVSQVSLFVNGTSVDTTTTVAGATLTFSTPNPVGSANYTYYLVATRAMTGDTVQSASTTFTLTNP